MLALVGLLAAANAAAHKASDSHLEINAENPRHMVIEWSVLLSDLEIAVGLDADGDQSITRAEFDRRIPAVVDYSMRSLGLATPAGPCDIRLDSVSTATQADQPRAVVAAHARCSESNELKVTYDFMFEKDALHRGLLHFSTKSGEQTAVFSPGARVQQFDLEDRSGASTLTFVREGVHHILIGYDHIAFLLLLLLPLTMVRKRNNWEPVASIKSIVFEALRVVTAFTIAHSITLGLAATDTLHIPITLAEILIALSVVAAALVNVFPVRAIRNWALAFGFGLVHGFGFASVFSELGTQGASLATTLVAFNVGVELGQLGIVIAVLPAVYFLSRLTLYRQAGMQAISVGIAFVGLVWSIERIGSIL